MQTPIRCLDACNNFTDFPHSQFLGFHTQHLNVHHHHHHHHHQNSVSYFTNRSLSPRVSCSFSERDNHGGGERGKVKVKVNGKAKDNVWSIDNEIAKVVEEKVKERERWGKRKRGKGKRVKKVGGDQVANAMVTGAMLMEVETVMQTQEPVIRPAWNTFVSSVSGIWKGVGAVFSPITAEMEPVETGSKNEYLYDCYTLSNVQAVQPGEKTSQIQRKINWVTLNPYGERQQEMGGGSSDKDGGKHGDVSSGFKGKGHRITKNHVMPKFESFNFEKSDLMEEDIMGSEPGLVFFEDGSYSRGPVEIPVGEEVNESQYYLSPTYKFEQCLVKGCHKRLRIVHTIEFSNGGADIQILRVAVYEEQWVGSANFDEQSEVDLDVKPFSQRKRIRPSDLTGQWKVFEVSSTPIYGDEPVASEESNGPPYVYFCLETMKKRSLPENPAYFREEEMLDMQDMSVLWLPGGVTAYVDVNKEGILCIGVGWYSDEGINLVMERDYETDGKLREVRSKTEVKRRWSDPLPM